MGCILSSREAEPLLSNARTWKSGSVLLQPPKVIASALPSQEPNGEKCHSLARAAMYGNLHATARLLKNGFQNENAQEILDQSLLSAARYGHLSICELLVQHRANPSASTLLSESALMFAATEGYTEVCRLLLDNNADVYAKTKWARTTAAIGVREALEDSAKERAFYRRTSLQQAVIGVHTDVVRLLIEHKADVRVVSSEDKSLMCLDKQLVALIEPSYKASPDSCFLCHVKFTLARRRGICASCNNFVCTYCSRNDVLVGESTKKQQACRECILRYDLACGQQREGLSILVLESDPQSIAAMANVVKNMENILEHPIASFFDLIVANGFAKCLAAALTKSSETNLSTFSSTTLSRESLRLHEPVTVMARSSNGVFGDLSSSRDMSEDLNSVCPLDVAYMQAMAQASLPMRCVRLKDESSQLSCVGCPIKFIVYVGNNGHNNEFRMRAKGKFKLLTFDTLEVVDAEPDWPLKTKTFEELLKLLRRH